MKGIDDRIIAGDFDRCVNCPEYDPDPARGCPLVPVTSWDSEADELEGAEWVD